MYLLRYGQWLPHVMNDWKSGYRKRRYRRSVVFKIFIVYGS